MSLTEEKRHALIQYRIEQAKETVEEAHLLITHDKLRAGINRIYYGMFYMLLALGLKYRFETSKHVGNCLDGLTRPSSRTERLTGNMEK